ncbi:lipoprotein e(P4) family 5'-nucleotidase [Treponema maltophilum ATCC 51939]|jgi:5'-nucleotidase, lipoprotein e(P4) family|uniref:Lipoprotein e(P4) family 5'-nucleotidase n=1 Tax=Treponema maltophilum ATCC 51939 TaxID=1125699 RepID=S3JWP8_TREMA|nr:5'-nucleotidase, lipoprotein e(P4) family [Treponema maltophilum]EPF30398.1 lipoprotein e(P4) family 5'-nucleotidase [Treponema maltophilum ATCC 51939]
MIKRITKSVSAIFIAAVFFVSCASASGTAEKAKQAAAKNEADEVLLAEQGMLAYNWMQQSGEYRALAYQAFNAAKAAFDAAVPADGMKKAVVVDLDETMIDNSAEGAIRLLEHKEFDPSFWTRWCEAEQALAIPGAVEFANYVNSHGGKMFYVSNRIVGPEYQPTINNLKALGFTGVDSTSVLLKDKVSQKTARFEQVEKAGYEIVVFIGDNLDDFRFTGETYRKLNDVRRSVVDKYKSDFGVKYIVLPNPLYGNWEGGLNADYYKNDAAGKLKIRRDNLKVWKK